MPVLSRELRRTLESTVKAARREAEAGAHKTLEHLAVHHHEPWQALTPEQRSLRLRLRAHGRQLGDRRDEHRGTQEITRLTAECAYEHWHRMLFARFLAESDLLVEPDTGMALTLDECRELARERGVDWLELASSFATRMLPQIFRAGDPLLEVELPPETRSELEKALEALPQEVFLDDDSLGWVYQFWQADRKDEINRSEQKIGAEELAAVTQLFTEDYMVLFLLHNTLGAWWAGKVLAAHSELARTATSEDQLRSFCKVGDIDWAFLRFVREGEEPWRPVASTFDGWPKTASEIRLLDPSMGSGHFLVFAFTILTALRMAEESLSASDAVEAVLRDNLYGLEIDPRCTQIAAFNLALAAWRRIGYRPLPRMHLACSGLSIGVSKAEWLKMAERAAADAPVPPEKDLFGTKDNLFSARIKEGFSRLYNLFEQAPILGSLIDPSLMTGDIEAADYFQLEPLLTPMFANSQADDMKEMAVAAQGMMKAAEILGQRFTLVATNVPYLGRGKQDEVLKNYCGNHHADAKADLATSFMERCIVFCNDGGSVALVTPQNWLFLPGFTEYRIKLLKTTAFDAIARLGANAFQDMNFWAATTALAILSRSLPSQEHRFNIQDTSTSKDRSVKERLLRSSSDVLFLLQASQLKNPDARIGYETNSSAPLLAEIAKCPQGVKTGDDSRRRRTFWEITLNDHPSWKPLRGAPDRDTFTDGASYLIDLGDGEHSIARLQGQSAWDKTGIVLKLMGEIVPSLYYGEVFDSNVTAVVPRDEKLLPALWVFVHSSVFKQSLHAMEQAAKVNNATVGKVPFDALHWQVMASSEFPSGLPKPHSDDPTQWLFGGHPRGAEQPLQVAVARLLNYRWPRQADSCFPECPALGSDGLEKHADPDGVVPLTPLRGEAGATERLIALLADAFGPEWSAAKLAGLLADVGFEGKNLDDWLRDGFFSQHCDLFHQRPFVWHVWDGRRDGFHALVNYHRLSGPDGEGRRVLETLIYAYLGGWIDRQRVDQRAGVEGADGRLAAAEHLRGELEKILSGEPPYDIFIRWKPLHEQPIGWEPDVNDGVRLNIRPFITARPLNARSRGACILRTTPRIKWDKDRGKEPNRPREDFPWFWNCDGVSTDFPGGREFDGNRWNNLHYSRVVKEAARSRKGSGK